jgi:hypothetical protein
VYCDAANIPTPYLDFTGVETRANRQSCLFGSRAKRQGASNCPTRPVERRQEAVAGGLDQSPTVLFDDLPCYLVVSIQQPSPRLIALFNGT